MTSSPLFSAFHNQGSSHFDIGAMLSLLGSSNTLESSILIMDDPLSYYSVSLNIFPLSAPSVPLPSPQRASHNTEVGYAYDFTSHLPAAPFPLMKENIPLPPSKLSSHQPLLLTHLATILSSAPFENHSILLQHHMMAFGTLHYSNLVWMLPYPQLEAISSLWWCNASSHVEAFIAVTLRPILAILEAYSFKKISLSYCDWLFWACTISNCNGIVGQITIRHGSFGNLTVGQRPESFDTARTTRIYIIK